MKGRLGYTREIATKICDELSRGRSLTDICRDDGMPAASTVKGWAARDHDGFAARYKSLRRLGQPTLYTAEIGEMICAKLCTGRSLLDVCRDEGMPLYATVYSWAKNDREGFGTLYRHAREIGFLAMADELLDIADDSRNDFVARRRADGSVEHVVDHENIARARLRIETRRWLLSRALPKIYGDRIDLKATHDAGDTLLEVMKAIDGKTRGLPSGDLPPGG